ncbi:MAG: hypothetical protein M3Y33_06070 [Actinomycetota bacterium]|nr:hypothetical protein [Actinomycetota bacterium]
MTCASAAREVLHRHPGDQTGLMVCRQGSSRHDAFAYPAAGSGGFRLSGISAAASSTLVRQYLAACSPRELCPISGTAAIPRLPDRHPGIHPRLDFHPQRQTTGS